MCLNSLTHSGCSDDARATHSRAPLLPARRISRTYTVYGVEMLCEVFDDIEPEHFGL